MKIFLLADAQSPHTLRWVEALTHKGHEIHLASFNQLKPETAPTTMHFYKLPTFGIGKISYLLNIFKIKKLCQNIQPDVIHAHHITSYGFLGALSGFHPFVITGWGTDLLISSDKSIILKFFNKYAIEKADYVTTVAEHMNKKALELTHKKIKILALPFGIDIKIFRPTQTKSSLKNQTITIISTRNFAPIYDIETLIQAFALCCQKHQHIRLQLIGSGPLLESLQQLSSTLNLTDKISFIGKVPHKKLPDYLSQADIFVSSSLSDGNNISLNEAMACGLYPIATAIPANQQWIEHQKNGLLYSPANLEDLASQINYALIHPEQRQLCLEANIQLVQQKASWDNCVTQTIEIYQLLITKNSNS